MNLEALGDSNTAGTVLTGTTYVQRMATSLGLGLSNYAVSGQKAMDQSYNTRNMSQGDLVTYMIGTNDSDGYGNSATKMGAYKKFLRNMILETSGFSLVKGASTTQTGTWATANTYNGSNAYGIYSTGAASVSATVYGTVVYFAYIYTTDPSFDCTFTVTIDGVLKDTVTLASSSEGVAGTTSNYGSAALRYGGLTDGAHTVVVATTGAGGKSLGVQFIMGNGHQPFKRPQLVFNIPKKLAYGGTDSATNNANYCTVCSDLVTELKADGFNVGLVDINSILVSTDYNSGDSIHINDTGHAKMAAAGLTALYGLGMSSGGGTTTVYPTGSFSFPCAHITGTWDGAGGITLPLHITT